MPPKRQARPSTPPSTKKKIKKSKSAQPSIDSFFNSPNKPRANGNEIRVKREKSIISFVDSDDDPVIAKKQIDGDEELARKLTKEWEEDKLDKGKARDLSTSLNDEDGNDEIVEVEAPYSEPLGLNGSSTSSHLLPPVKFEEKEESKPIVKLRSPQQTKPDTEKGIVAQVKPVASIFKSKTPPPPESKSDTKSPATPSKSSTITSTSSEPVDPINFDVDAFLFQPSDIDRSKWPKGRLPYSVLVGVYVQVSSTRSRLTIVRVLTK